MKTSALSMFAEDTLKNFNIFLEEHDEKMKLLNKHMDSDQISVTLESIAPVIEIKYADANIMDGKHVELDVLVKKPLITLANLCNQCKDLTKTAQQYQLKFLLTDAQIGEIEEYNENLQTESILLKISCAMDFYCQLYFLLKRIIAILQNMWHQLTASMSIHSEVHLYSVFDSMTELLEHIVVFNEITIKSNLSSNWSLYRKWLQTLSKSKDTSDGGTKMEFNGLHTSLKDMESAISGNIFRIFLDSLLDLKKQLSLKDINSITQHSNGYLRQKILEIEAIHSNDYKTFQETRHIVRLAAYISALYELGIQIETKSVKTIADIFSKYPILALYKNVHWSPSLFLSKYAKAFLKIQDKVQDHNLKQQQMYLEKSYISDEKRCRHLCAQLALWSINAQRVFSVDVFGNLKGFSRLILMGQSYTEQIHCLIDGLINRHVGLMVPITAETIATVCKLIQYLKILQQSFAHNHSTVVRFLNTILQWQKQKLLELLLGTKKKILDLKVLPQKMNILSTLKLAEKSLNGSHQLSKSLTIVNLALKEFVENERSLPADSQKNLKSILLRANNLSNFQKNILAQFDYIHLIDTYWSLSISRIHELVIQPNNAYCLQNIITASYKLDKNVAVFKFHKKLSDKSDKVYDTFTAALSIKLEVFLRMEALSHLFLDQTLPFNDTIEDYRNFMSASATDVNGDYNTISDDLENYFTATYYNLTTIAPHDWKSYENMRHFAYRLFLLRPVDDYLPNQIVDQGIDVLQIMRNIHTFASSYSYNMNLQLFVENENKGKHLDIIGTRHVANSVQTHGTGIINTTVNFIYQFLRQKFYTFSTFLHDEQIKSRLLKEFRYYAECKQDKMYTSYPYERADSFIKKIRKLGISASGETYMDLFRKVITHVGNAVGYVRLLQSGSKSANYRSRSFMPRFNKNSISCDAPNCLHETTKRAISEHEKGIGHMKESYSDNTNYFKLLMQGFQPFLCNPHNYHLKTFFLITPALIMNYIDYRVKEKLKIYKKDQQKCSLFEDGFAVGLIYILNMLNQLSEFHELGWQSTINQQLNSERSKVKDIFTPAAQTKVQTNTQVKSNENEKLLQTVAITERHINAYENEYKLLYSSLSSAEIFFQ